MHSPVAPSRHPGFTRPVHVLAADPDLAGGLEGRELAEARSRVMAPAVALPAGAWHPCPQRPDGAFGVLILRGMLISEERLGGRWHAQIMGPGDVIDPWAQGDLLARARLWTAAQPSSLALLDGEFLRSAHRWAPITASLLRRLTDRAERLAATAAMSQLPRVDLRLLGFFWHLAERWGRVAPSGLVVSVRLTHEQLGRLVGARRPTVTLALGELDAAGLLSRRREGSWLLAGASSELLQGGGVASFAGVPSYVNGNRGDGKLPTVRKLPTARAVA